METVPEEDKDTLLSKACGEFELLRLEAELINAAIINAAIIITSQTPYLRAAAESIDEQIKAKLAKINRIIIPDIH